MLWPDGPLGLFANLLVNKSWKDFQFPIHFINGVDNVNWPPLRDLPWCDVYLRVIRHLWCPPWTLKNFPLCRGIFNSVSRGLSWKGLPLRELQPKGNVQTEVYTPNTPNIRLLFLLGGMSDLSWWHLHTLLRDEATSKKCPGCCGIHFGRLQVIQYLLEYILCNRD